jgi:protein Tex
MVGPRPKVRRSQDLTAAAKTIYYGWSPRVAGWSRGDRVKDVYVGKIAAELGVGSRQVAATAALLAEGGTVPFIARYRKEATGTLDEVAITAIRDRLAQLVELDERRAAILQSLQERELLTDELAAAVNGAETMTALEDIYAPYRPKRRTRATIAREAGLEPLADLLFADQAGVDPLGQAAAFVNPEKNVADAEAALAGARDILAERFSDDATARATLRQLYWDAGTVKSSVVPGKEEAGAKFKDYFDWTEPTASIPSHRMLAIRRGEAEGVLRVRVAPPDEDALGILERLFLKAPGTPGGEQVRLAAHDSYKRLLGSAIEGEIRFDSKKKADAEAIRVFADNLRQLLLAPPLGRKTVLAIDPGFRTGCKVVCLDPQGKLLHHDVVHPTAGSAEQVKRAGQTILALAARFNVAAIAIGNGTASRETEQFVRALELPPSIAVAAVSESGASIYSASDVAREEFPDQDVTVRGAVSIGRRLMDPLSELVKIEPKSIGVGQYQHDVDQGALKQTLDDVVVSCVNGVGVELNTASKQLLGYVSGLGPSLAGKIVAFRDENGPYRSRKDLLRVPRLGPKAFEQCAGFLRVRDGEHPLDASAVHPESYGVVDRMAGDLGCQVGDLLRDATLRSRIVLQAYVTDKVGIPTLTDILAELAKPGRDPRQGFEAFSFKEGVEKIEDLQPGMKLPGIVTNVTAFGAFVDIGVHQDGLVHVSQLADRFVKDPAEVVKVQQKVDVTVLEVDLPRKRIALSMRSNPPLTQPRENRTSPAAPRPGPSAPRAAASGSARPPQGGFRPAVQGGSRQPQPQPSSAFSNAFADAFKHVKQR